MSNTIDINDLRLNCDSVDSKPRNVDWAALLGEDLEGWEAFSAEDCEECGQVVLCSSRMGQDEHRYVAPTTTLTDMPKDGADFNCLDCGKEIKVTLTEDGYFDCPECGAFHDEGEEFDTVCTGHLYFEGPMMNSFYPCDLDDTEAAARAIAHLPLCVVEFEDGETGFALTGGGMDLSWEICDAYLSCGFLPPFHFCDLPDMAGKGREQRTQLILAACRRSVECLAGWTESRLGKLDRLSDKYKESAA